MIEDCTAIILAGGESKRMGQDKASIVLAGESLLNRAIANLQPLFDHIIISVREPQTGISLPQICDKNTKRAPMVGIATALDKIETNWVFVVAVDMPFISADLIRFLAKKRGNKQVVVPMIDEHLQPLFAYYAKACLPAMQQQIVAGNRSLRRFIDGLDSVIVPKEALEPFDSSLVSFLDLDSLKDLEYAENLLKKRQKT